MKDLPLHTDHILSLCRRYGLSCEGLEEAGAELPMPVPLLGSCSAGKSSLLNALLGTRALPTGLVPATAIPTELVFGGSNAVTAYHESHTRRLGLGDLRARGMDFSGVHLLRAVCNNPFLEQISRIRLVDTPGLDGQSREQEQILRDYLPQSLAYILVFSADEPVIKESVARFLFELRLREIPVVPVLTKADKIPPKELARARSFLEKSLRDLFLLEDISLCVVSARGDVEPVRRELLRLQERADSLMERSLADKRDRAADDLRAYLSLRREIAKLADNEVANREAALRLRTDEAGSLLEQRLDLFAARSGECREQIFQRMRTAVEEAAAPIETMLYEGNNPWEYIESMLRVTITAGLVDSYQPLVRSFFKQLTGLLKAHDLSLPLNAPEEDGGDREAKEVSRLFSGGEPESCLPEQSVWSPLEGTGDLLEQLVCRRLRGSRRQALMAREVEEEILPELCRRGGECVDKALEQSAARIKEAAGALLSRQMELIQKARADIRKERARRERHPEAEQVEDDWNALQAVLRVGSQS